MKKLLDRLGVKDLQSFRLLVWQFIKFGIVGVSNTLIFLGVYYGLVFLGLNYLLANLIGFVISVLNAYFWNSRYVFDAKGKTIRRLLKVFVSYGFTLLVSTGLLFLLVDVIGVSHLIAPIINLIITIPMNFLLNKFWSFK